MGTSCMNIDCQMCVNIWCAHFHAFSLSLTVFVNMQGTCVRIHACVCVRVCVCVCGAQHVHILHESKGPVTESSKIAILHLHTHTHTHTHTVSVRQAAHVTSLTEGCSLLDEFPPEERHDTSLGA